MSARWIVGASVVALALASCAPQEPGEGSWQGTIEERDGVVYVHNPAEGLWDDRDPFPLSLELEQVFGADREPREAILGIPAALTVDEQGNVYVLDCQTDDLIAFDAAGNVRWILDSHGGGPGDLRSAQYLCWDGGQLLYVSNQDGSRIDAFDLGGNFQSSQGMAEFDIIQGRIAGFIYPDTPVLWNAVRPRVGAQVYVFETGDPWSLVDTFFAEGGPDSADRWSIGLIPVRVGAGRIRAGHGIEYLLREFDTAGDVRTVIRREFRTLLPPVDLGGTGYGFGQFEAPLVLPNGIHLVPVSWATNVESVEEFVARTRHLRAAGKWPEIEWASALDVLDERGRYLGSLTWEGYFPDTGIIDEIGPDGRLYTWSTEPFPQVRRYRVVIEE